MGEHGEKIRIDFKTKLKAVISNPTVEGETKKIVDLIAGRIGRNAGEYIDRAREVIRYANRIRAKELGIDPRLLISYLDVSDYILHNGGKVVRDVDSAIDVIYKHEFPERYEKKK